MAQIHWTLDVGGFFNNPLSWTPTQVPGAADTAILDAPGGMAYTVVSRSGVLGLALGGTQVAGGLQTASNATLQVVGDIDVLDALAGDTTFYAVNGTAGGANAGTIVIQDAVFVVPILNTLLGATARFEFRGTMNNTGTIVLNGQPHLLGLLDADQTTYLTGLGSTILTGGGHVTMSNQRLNVINGGSITNVNNTISGSGAIVPTALINQAAGIVDANQSVDLVVAATTTTNSGLIEATNHGTLVITRTVDNTSGGVVESNGGRVDLQAVDMIGGTLKTINLGLMLTNEKGSLLDGRAQALTISGEVIITHGTNLSIEGTINNTGQLLVASTILHPDITDLIVGAGGATLTGGGEVNLTQLTENRIYGVSSGTTLTNVDNRMAGAGQFGNGVLTLVNEAGGTIVGNFGGLTINTGANVIVNAGLITTQSGGIVTVQSAVNNTGILEVHSGTATFNGAVTGSGQAVVAAGTLYFASTFSENVSFNGGTGVLELAHSVSYSGTLINFSKSGGTSLDLRDIAFGGSTKATYSGTSAGGTLTVTDGSHTAHIKMNGNYLGSTFTVSSDGHGGTSVKDPTAPAAITPHQFIAAAASLGAHAAGSVSLGHGDMQPHSPMLAKPAVMVA